jgi:hypothetical protein
MSLTLLLVLPTGEYDVFKALSGGSGEGWLLSQSEKENQLLGG